MAGTAVDGRAGGGVSWEYTTIKARLYPTPAQAELFEKTFGCCRYLWNQMLADEQRFYSETGTHFIPTPAKYKGGAPFLKEVDNQALIQEHNRLSQAFRAFFRDPEHFRHPRFKRKKEGRDSFTASNHVFDSGPTIYLTEDGIRMTKAGVVRAVFPRRPRSGWKLRRITVYRTPTGKYFCAILYQYPARAPAPVTPTPERTLGLNHSAAHFYVTDGGQTADPPRFLENAREKLSRLQRRLARMEPGSRNYQEAAERYRLLHEHIANQRLDFIHKESRRIANAWDAVCVRVGAPPEAAPRPADGFGMFRNALAYKLARQGKALVTVDPFTPTSRVCSGCGYRMPEAVGARKSRWTCPACGAVHRREVNAAQNIKKAGFHQVLSGQTYA